MRLAIISDTHDNLANLAKFLAHTRENRIAAIIHCGDVASGDTLEYLAKNFNGKIHLAFGNMDYRDSVAAATKKIGGQVVLFEEFGQTKFNGLKIGFCHHREIALEYCRNGKYDFMFYGHSHKPWKEIINGCVLANPGNLAGTFYKATFAILDTKTRQLDLVILDQIKKIQN